jgi:hypothetical protein
LVRVSMAKHYGYYQDGFDLECAECGKSTLQVGIERLAANPTIECYQCGHVETIQNSEQWVQSWREARKAMQALHELIDKREAPTWAVVMGAKIFRAYSEE